MEKTRRLEQIANGIQAANKIQQVYRSTLRNDDTSTVRADRKAALFDILGIIAEFSPDTYRSILGDTIDKSHMFGEAYRNIKHHLRVSRNQSINREMLVQTLGHIRPIVGNRRKALIDKVLKIYEILNS